MPSVDSTIQLIRISEQRGSHLTPDGRQQIIPVTYMNSSAALKASCGERGGGVCTSSNAARVLDWAFAHGQRDLFFPDQHLGRSPLRMIRNCKRNVHASEYRGGCRESLP